MFFIISNYDSLAWFLYVIKFILMAPMYIMKIGFELRVL